MKNTAYPVEKVFTDLRNAPDYAAFQRISDYISRNESEYAPSDFEILTENAGEIEDKKFNPKECSQITNIYYKSKSGITATEWIPLGLNRSISTCSEAHDLGIPIAEWMYDIYPDLDTFKIEMRVPTSYERELAGGVLTTPEERRREVRMPEREVARETKPEVEAIINLPELLERQRRDFEELIEAARTDNRREMERLRETINRLQSRIEASQGVQPKTISRVLDTSQYAYFTRNAYKLSVPVSQSKIARGEYQVSLYIETPEQEKEALTFLDEVESHERVIVSREAKAPGYQEVVELLCNNFERHTNFSCGLNRTGSLSTLADRLIEYAASQGTEWDKMFDIASLNLFPSGNIDIRKVREKRGIYPAELASEAFNAAITQVQGKQLARRVEEETVESCGLEVMQGYIMEFDAILLIQERGRFPQLPDELVSKRSDAVNALSRCGYYPNNLETLRNEVDSEMRNIGTSYMDQVEAMADSFVRRYGVRE